MARSVAGTTTGAVLAIVALGVLLSERVGAGWLLVAGAFVGLAPSLFA
jgi:hypothetical protein